MHLQWTRHKRRTKSNQEKPSHSAHWAPITETHLKNKCVFSGGHTNQGHTSYYAWTLRHFFLFSTDRSGMTHQVKGTANTSSKARTANTASNWIVPFMCIRVSGVSALIEMRTYTPVSHLHIFVLFLLGCVMQPIYLHIQQLSICQPLYSHPTSGGEYQCALPPGGLCAWRCVCVRSLGWDDVVEQCVEHAQKR